MFWLIAEMAQSRSEFGIAVFSQFQLTFLAKNFSSWLLVCTR